MDTDALKGVQFGRKQNNFFISHRHWISGPFLVKILGSVSIALILPCAILTATSPTIVSSYSAQCDLAWGYSVIVMYMGVYSIFFMVSWDFFARS